MRAYLYLSLVFLTGCANHNYEPIVDTQGVDMNLYAQDLNDCQGYARGVNTGAEAAQGAAGGAVVGAMLGAIVGGAVDSTSARNGAGYGAAYGAVSGGAKGVASGGRGQKDVIRRCLQGRGYSVLR